MPGVTHLLPRFIEFSLLLLVTIVLSSCAGVKPLTAEQPRQEAFRSSDAMVTSTVMVPFEISTAEIAKLLNKTLRSELYKGASSTRGVSVTIKRNGTISMNAADNFIYLTVPITLSLSYSMFESRAIPLTLKFKVHAGITSDWQLHAEIYYLGLSDLLAEEIGVGPFSFKPRSIVDGLTQPVQKLLSGVVAQKVNELLPLKRTVASAWQTMQQPLPLDDRSNIWLQLLPREITMYPLTAQNNRIRVSIGVTTGATLLIGAQPPARPPVPLPAIRPVSNFDKAFRITLNGTLPYRDLRAIAAPLLLDKTFDTDGKQVTVKDFDLYGNGDKIVIKLVTTGSLEGTFYLTAKTLYDAATKTLAVTEVDFDLQTRDLLLTSADWFLHSSIRNTLEEKLNMKITRQLEQVRQTAEKMLTKIPLTNALTLQGTLTALTFKEIIVQKDTIAIQMQAEGETTLVFH
jgi:hypothetical protein